MIRTAESYSVPSLVLLVLALPLLAGYKPRRWEPGPAEGYAARLTSEGVTIAVQPYLDDALAAGVFDKDDMVTSGIMPLAVVIFNDNDFPIAVKGEAIELTNEDGGHRSLEPKEAAAILFTKGKKSAWIPSSPIPRIPSGKPAGPSVDEDALNDLQYKYLGTRVVQAKGRGGGFLYFRVPVTDLRPYLKTARIYIPDICHHGTGKPLIYFEIELEPSIIKPLGK